jgi:hypothetical protein
LCCVIGFPEAIEKLRQMTWKIGAGDCKICLQLAFENPSHFLVSQIDHYGSPRISGPAAGSIATGVRRTFIELMPNCLKMISSRARPSGLGSHLGVGLKLGSMLDVSPAGPRMAIRSGPIDHSFVVASVGFPCRSHSALWRGIAARG